MRSVHHGLEASTSQDELLALVDELNADRRGGRDPGPATAPGAIDQDAVIAAIDPRRTSTG